MQPLAEGPLARCWTDAMAFLRLGADAAFVATPRGWGGVRARRVRRRPPEVPPDLNTWVERKSRIAESFAKRVLRMTKAQNRGARFRRELGLHGQTDAGTATNRPNLEAWASPFRALSSPIMALTRPPLPAGSAPRPRRDRDPHLTRPPMTDLAVADRAGR